MQKIEASDRKTKNLTLEGLRGFSALLVFFWHVFPLETFSPGNKLISPTVAQILTTIFNGRVGVFFFFILSGYVMGKVYSFQKPFPLKNYLLKRLIRIYPMYAISVLFSAILLPTSLWQVFGHLLFLNPNFVDTITANTVLWAVSYESGFYIFLTLIFAIPILKNSKGITALIICLLLNLFICIFDLNRYGINSWIKGLSIWLLGLVLSWNTNESIQQHNSTIDTKNTWSFIILAIGMDSCINGVNAILKSIFPLITQELSDVTTLLTIPSVLLAFLSLINIKVKRELSLAVFISTFTLILSVILGTLIKGAFWNWPVYPTTLCLALIALGIRFIDLPKSWNLRHFAALGSISYGVYIFHMPFMELVAKIPYLGGGWIEWFIRFILYCFLTILTSYLLEIKLQPVLRNMVVIQVKK